MQQISQLAQRIKLPGQDTPVEGLLDFETFGLRGYRSVPEITIGAILSRALPLIFVFAGIGLLLMLITAGYEYLTSAGDAKKLEQGKQRLTNAIIGFLIIFAAFWLVQALGAIFGLTSITEVFE